MPFALITSGEKTPDLPVLARVLAAGLGLDQATAAGAARHCWGVLGEDLDEAAAAGLEARCAEAGIGALRVTSPLPALPVPEMIKKPWFQDGAAFFAGSGVRAEAAPGSVLLLAAAPVKEETSRSVRTTEGPSGREKAVRLGIMAVTGLPIGLGKDREVTKEVKTSELRFYLDVILAEGPRRLRLSSDDLDFSCLKEKKTYSSQMNFRVLCAELAAFAPAAWKNAGLRAILEGKQLNLLPYDSLADLEKETARLLSSKRG